MPKRVVSKRPSDHSALALIPSAPTYVKDSFVNSIAQRNAASTASTSIVPISTASAAEHGNASITVMRRSIPFCKMCLKEGGLTPVQEVYHILHFFKGETHARHDLVSL